MYNKNHTVLRAAGSGDIFTVNEHMTHNDFSSRWKDVKPLPPSSPPTTHFEIQSCFYADFLPAYMETNASSLTDWEYERGPPSDDVFDHLVTEFYQKYLPSEVMVSRSEAAELLQFYPEFYDEEEVDVILSSSRASSSEDSSGEEEEAAEGQEEEGQEEDDEDFISIEELTRTLQADPGGAYDLISGVKMEPWLEEEEEDVYILGEHDEDQTGSTAWNNADTLYEEDLPSGRNLLEDSEPFDERWLMSNLKRTCGPANFVREIMTKDFSQLTEEKYEVDKVAAASKDPAAMEKILLERNIEIGFSMLRKMNNHVVYVESLEEEGLFEAKHRGEEEEEEEEEKEKNEEDGRREAVVVEGVGESDDEIILSHVRFQLQYCVGQSLAHKRFGPCVVIGWDKSCMASDDWCEINQIDTLLTYGRNQPFYNVLFEDGEHRYCSQENLRLRPSDQCVAPIKHKAVGYFFVDYNDGMGLHVLNEHLRRKYPDDETASGADVLLPQMLKEEATSGGSGADEDANATKETEAEKEEEEEEGLEKTRKGIHQFIKLRENR